jgi:hypothetical protein
MWLLVRKGSGGTGDWNRRIEEWEFVNCVDLVMSLECPCKIALRKPPLVLKSSKTTRIVQCISPTAAILNPQYRTASNPSPLPTITPPPAHTPPRNKLPTPPPSTSTTSNPLLTPPSTILPGPSSALIAVIKPSLAVAKMPTRRHIPSLLAHSQAMVVPERSHMQVIGAV